MWHVGRSNSYSSSSCDDVGVGASASTPTMTLVNAAPNGGRSSLSTDPLSAAAAAVDGLLSEPMEHRLWSQLLLSSGNGGTMHNNHGVGGENFLDLLNSKSLAPSFSTRPMKVTRSPFNGCLKKQEVGVKASKHCMMNSSESNERKKQAYEVTSIRGDGRNSGAASVGKKRKSEESSEALLKKPKNESSSAAASLRVQVPKVKMAEKITALQQIVSPFGKTDTASVLQETIVYIKFLHEQVQLLSDPYIKSSSCKDQNLWGVDQRKEKEEAKLELRSRGLCLVPLSCTSQVYRDNNGPDYWTLPYRSCLYR
uniref:BHLH domain-containing protein n=1 Tax=Ananas comosus var. bracteatus TaxID=296719 RepID=A0A6V7PWV6_ANACO|nr:unnamed protein product [Ananas comosus var. bracteatus]